MSRKSVIITGGAAGLGAGIAQTFAAEGYRVGVLDLDPATTAGPFETAFQDVIGFAVFLWLASLLLHWLT